VWRENCRRGPSTRPSPTPGACRAFVCVLGTSAVAHGGARRTERQTIPDPHGTVQTNRCEHRVVPRPRHIDDICHQRGHRLDLPATCATSRLRGFQFSTFTSSDPHSLPPPSLLISRPPLCFLSAELAHTDPGPISSRLGRPSQSPRSGRDGPIAR
jgi:hypothetical protein